MCYDITVSDSKATQVFHSYLAFVLMYDWLKNSYLVNDYCWTVSIIVCASI